MALKSKVETVATPDDDCPKCHTYRSEHHKFCSNCGYSFVPQMTSVRINLGRGIKGARLISASGTAIDDKTTVAVVFDLPVEPMTESLKTELESVVGEKLLDTVIEEVERYSTLRVLMDSQEP